MTLISTGSRYIAGTWSLDPEHSGITFSIRHLVVSRIRGVFRRFNVEVTTARNPLESKITACIDVASVDTQQAERDGHLRSSDFFAVDDFPSMYFSSTGVQISGARFTLNGDLTLRGVTKSVSLKGEFGGITTDSSGRLRAGASASTKIDRTAFGVNWNAALEAGGLTLGNDVLINFEIQLVLEDGTAATTGNTGA